MRHVTTRLLVRAAVVLAFSTSASLATAQPAAAPAPINVSALGPQVGQRVPDFRLTDQAGKQWTRDSIMGPKGAMLVFFRSADW